MEEKIKKEAENTTAPEAKETEKNQEKAPEKDSAKVKPDKLEQLKAKQEKAAAVLEKAAKKAKAIQEEIAVEEKKLHDKEIKNLDNACKTAKISLAEVTKLITLISENSLTVSDITEMIGGKTNG